MASTHTKLAARVDDQQYKIKGRNAGGKLHQRGQKNWKPQVSPIAAQAVVVHVEKVEVALEVKIMAGLTRANAMIEAERVAEADRVLTAAAQARYDICNIAHVPSTEGRHAQIAAQIAAYN